MPIPLRDIRRIAAYEARTQGESILGAALEDSQWRSDAHCRECGFLERVSTGYRAVSVWRCVNLWRDLWQQYGFHWYMTAKEQGHLSPCELVGESEWQFPRYEVNPGSFACWLFRPGEALSVHYWRDGRWAEYLALRALAGESPSPQQRIFPLEYILEYIHHGVNCRCTLCGVDLPNAPLVRP